MLFRSRVAILADGWGSSFVARGIACDGRFAAAVCDGGIWDLHERAFLIDRNAQLEPGMIGRLGLNRVARNISCPVLIATGERGWLKAERVRELYGHLKAEGRTLTDDGLHRNGAAVSLDDLNNTLTALKSRLEKATVKVTVDI